ncbi:MAG: oligosaccharide flippase family protein, partial [Nanoarchaeota archaeon]
MGYFKDTFRGISWMALLRGSTRGLAIVKTIVLARFLSPSQFGLYGIAILVLGLLEILTETGVNVVLIQEEGKTDEYISTAWVVSILRGIFVTLLILVLAPTISSFFSSPTALNLIRFSSLIPLVRGFINPSVVKFQKELKFNKEFWFRSSLFLVDTAFAISLGILTGSEY